MAVGQIPASSDGVRRKAEIVSASVELFARRGYHETSMNEIAKVVGLSKATFYHYFSSKEELVITIHEELMDRLFQGQHTRLQHQKLSSESELRSIIKDLLDLLDTHPYHIRVFADFYRVLPEDVSKRVAKQRQDYRRSIEAVIRRGLEQGEFSRKADPAYTAHAIIALWHGASRWFQSQGPYSPQDVADRISFLLLDGLRDRQS